MKKILFCALAVLFLFACKDKDDKDDSSIDFSNIKASDLTEISPIFADINYPEAVYKVHPKKDTIFEHSSGSEITISSGTFVFNNGDEVKDEVKLIYKEFRTASDIILNDLSLKYDSAGLLYDFRTAGMFKIAAYSKGEEVFIKENCDCVYGNLKYIEPRTEKVIRNWKSRSFENGLFEKSWTPAHPTFYCKKSIYEKYGLYRIDFKIAADVELMYRFLQKNHISNYYLDRYLVTMRQGGVSSSGLKSTITITKEMIKAFKDNGNHLNLAKYLFYKGLKIKEFFINNN